MTWKITSDQVNPPGDAAITYDITNAGGVFNLRSTGTVDYEIEWGDGAVEISTLNTLPHTYTAGDYSVVVYSDSVYRPFFDNVGADANQITSVAIGPGADLGTDLTSAWNGASNMTSFVCPFDATSGVTNFLNPWKDCSSLTSFPLIDTSSGTDFYEAWRLCSGLASFPLIDTSSAISLFYTWSECTNLTSFPLIDTSNVTTLVAAWRFCSSLTSFPLIDTSKVQGFDACWWGCSITSFPLIDTSQGVSFTYTWNSNDFTTFPALDFSSGKDFSNCWNGCGNLADFPANMFDTTGTLVTTAFQDTWSNCALTAQSIENILVSLDTNGASNINLGINGGTNAAKTTWSAAAVTAYDNLIVKGWTISFNA